MDCLSGCLGQGQSLDVVWGKTRFWLLACLFFSGEARLIKDTADLALVKATKHGFEQQTAEKNRVLV